MSFIDGVSQAVGIRFGMSLMNRGEIRPILRKRFLANIVYIVSLVYCISKSFSIQPADVGNHIFLAWLDKNEWFVLLVMKTGKMVRDPWMFTYTVSIIATIVTIVVILMNVRRDRNVLHLSRVGYAIVTVVYSLVTYAIIYDCLYYWFGNTCVPFVNILCVNFASSAGTFATWALVVYIFRSSYVLLPLEKGTVAFFGNGILDLRGGGLFLIPTLPAPHIFCVLCTYAFDMIPFLWDMYHHPDGRERAVQNHLR